MSGYSTNKRQYKEFIFTKKCSLKVAHSIPNTTRYEAGALNHTEKQKRFLTNVLNATVLNSTLRENTPRGSGKPELWPVLHLGSTWRSSNIYNIEYY